MEKPGRYETASDRLVLKSYNATVGIDDGDEVYIYLHEVDEVVTYLLYWKKWKEEQDQEQS